MFHCVDQYGTEEYYTNEKLLLFPTNKFRANIVQDVEERKKYGLYAEYFCIRLLLKKYTLEKGTLEYIFIRHVFERIQR